MHCGCGGVDAISVKSAAQKKELLRQGGHVFTRIAFHTRNLGAAFQDRLYGAGMRLHNAMVKDAKKLLGHRCTVCGQVKLV